MPASELTTRPLGCFADAALPPVVYPLAGSFVVAGFLLAAGVAAGGIWAARRLCRRPAIGAGRWALRALGGAACSAALCCGLIGCVEYVGEWLVAALVFALAGVGLLWAAASGRRGPAPHPAGAVNRSGATACQEGTGAASGSSG